jgi:hypothetical protein
MFEQFPRERQNIHNVTPATIEWYTRGLRWLGTETPTDSDLKALGNTKVVFCLRLSRKCRFLAD